MIIKYYKYGLRPVFEEVKEEFSIFYAFQWETGEFKQDVTYAFKIFHDTSGDTEELNELEFNDYVDSLKREKGL